MSLPSVTKLEQVYSLGGLYKEVFGYLNGPTSYVTGGVLLTARDVGLTTIQMITFEGMLADRKAEAVFAANDSPEASILMLITDLAGTEVANASNQSTKKFRFRATGLY